MCTRLHVGAPGTQCTKVDRLGPWPRVHAVARCAIARAPFSSLGQASYGLASDVQRAFDGRVSYCEVSQPFYLVMAALVFMLSNAISERVFSLQNHIKGVRSTRMDTTTLDIRIRVASDAPPISSDAADTLDATVTDAYWSSFSPAPSRAAGAAAALLVRRKRSEEVAATKQAAKMARIDGSENQVLTGDDSAALTKRVEFSHERFRAKNVQPTEVTGDLTSGLMAKLMVSIDDDGRTETWEVGRLKSAKEVRVVLPQGGTAVSCYIFVWQALDAWLGEPPEISFLICR
jgi:hypothetical protein